jgi:hypothetical protein
MSGGGSPPPSSIRRDLAAARPRHPAGLCGLARAGEPVHALRVRRLDGQEVPHHPVRAVRRLRRGALRQPAPGQDAGAGDRGQDGRGRVAVAPGQDPDRVLQRGQAAARLRAHRVHLLGVHVPRPRGTRGTRGAVYLVPACDQQGRPWQAQRGGPPLAAASLGPVPDRCRAADQPDRARVDAGLRRFLDAHDEVLASRIKREVRHKLETGCKSASRRATQPRSHWAAGADGVGQRSGRSSRQLISPRRCRAARSGSAPIPAGDPAPSRGAGRGVPGARSSRRRARRARPRRSCSRAARPSGRPPTHR